MRPKDEEREKARELRTRGWPLRKIASEIDVALSSVSVWVRDVEMPGNPTVDPLTRPTRVGFAVKELPLVHGAESLRRCGKCALRKPLTAFGRHPSGRQWWCKKCFKAYFAKRGQLHYDQTRVALAKRKREARNLTEVRRSSGCVDCGEPDISVLEFDHVGHKTEAVSEMIWVGASVKRIARELDSCEVVCVNCHRRRTYLRSGNCWRNDPECFDRDRSLARGERRNLIYIRDLLAQSACCDCEEEDLVLLEFDHRSDKAGLVTVMARRGCSLEKLRAEIEKCDIRCANCHRRKTLRERRALFAGLVS